MTNFSTRIAALERRISGTGDGGRPIFMITLVTGCLPGPINYATAGQHRWERQANESEESFAERAATAAKAAGELSIVIGGLPADISDLGVKYGGDFDAWWQAECAPYYSEIPPEEPAGLVRRGVDR